MIVIKSGYATHLPAVVAAFVRTKGPVLEVGSGWFSTPVLRDLAELTKREVLSIEESVRWAQEGTDSLPGSMYHSLRWRRSYAGSKEFQKSWGLVILDNNGAEQREELLRTLRGKAKVVVVHEALPRPMKAALREWKYGVWLWHLQPWSSAIVSDTIDVREWGLQGALPMQDETGRILAIRRQDEDIVSGVDLKQFVRDNRDTRAVRSMEGRRRPRYPRP